MGVRICRDEAGHSLLHERGVVRICAVSWLRHWVVLDPVGMVPQEDTLVHADLLCCLGADVSGNAGHVGRGAMFLHGVEVPSLQCVLQGIHLLHKAHHAEAPRGSGVLIQGVPYADCSSQPRGRSASTMGGCTHTGPLCHHKTPPSR